MKVLIIRDPKGHVYYVGKVEDISELDYLKLKKEAEATQKEIERNIERVDEELRKVLNDHEHEIKVLKGEE